MKPVKPVVIVLCAVLLGAVAACAALLPRTLDSYRTLQTELAASPTPTADVRSMLRVTLDPNNTPAPTSPLLKTGVRGDEVRRLQERLQALGYYAGELDGQYGQGTAEAVKLFQAQHGLTSDGVAGEATLSQVYASTAQTFVPTPTPTAAASLLKKGDSGEAVREMQQRLKELGYYSGDVDGAFGGGTEEAVRLFQSQGGLEVDGVAAQKTFALLYSGQAKTVTVTPTPDPAQLPVLVNRTHPIEAGYKPRDLVVLKNVLPSSLVTVKGSSMEGDRAAVNALIKLFEAAVADGVTGWQISAAYRSYEYQQSLFDKQVQEYLSQGFSREKAVSATRNTVADPGTSEHHTGLAFDITVAGTSFKGTPQQKWLHKNCWDHGFIIRYQEDKEKITGFIAECWHIRYVGLPHSTDMRNRNLCLEEYLGQVE